MSKFKVLSWFGAAIMLIPLGYLIYFNYPRIIYAVYPDLLQQQINQIASTEFFTQTEQAITPPSTQNNPESKNITPVQLIIPKIGVNTTIIEAAESEQNEALAKGVWRLPRHGNFENTKSNPTVLAGHRWGSIDLSTEYRNQNLFINLPSLQTGDVITIIKNNVTTNYLVNQVEYSTTINKLDDLILVTCQYLDTPDRIIVYAQKL